MLVVKITVLSATTVLSMSNDTQLTLEQHRFELCRSTYTFFKTKYYGNTSTLVELKDMEPWVRGANYKVILGCSIAEGQHPNPHVFQRLTVVHYPLGMGSRRETDHDARLGSSVVRSGSEFSISTQQTSLKYMPHYISL